MKEPKADIFRIIERFKIADRGTVYVLRGSQVDELKLEDILYDLQGNRFKVTGIEHFSGHCFSYKDSEIVEMGFLLEMIDGRVAEGNILLRDQIHLNFLFCNHPLDRNKVDEDYGEEYKIAREEHSCALFGYEDMECGKLSLYGDEISGLTVYRGRMMKPEMYKDFYNKLWDKGIILVNSPEEYDWCYMLPGRYQEFKDDMPEYRVLVFAGNITLIDDYWESRTEGKITETEVSWIREKAKSIRSNFVTMDIARHENGKLIIREIGDGQVSDLQQIDAEKLYRQFNPNCIWLDDIPAEDFLPDGAVIMGADPMPTKSIEEMRDEVDSLTLTKDMVDAYATVHNKFWFIEDDIYDYTEGTIEYQRVSEKIDAWGALMDYLEKRILTLAEEEGLISAEVSNTGIVKRLELFMGKYGYRDGAGWWIKIEDK